MIPNGYPFYQPEMNWNAPPYLGFDQVVDQLITVRAANPRFKLPTDRASVERDVEQYAEQHLRSTYGEKAKQWLVGEPGPYANPMYQPPRERAGEAVARSAKAKVGIRLVMDFLGPSLKPVPHELAEQRASVCVTCPQNKPGSLISHTGGLVLKMLLQARSDLKLETSHDANLHDCHACDCNLHLKPHVSIDYILSKTPPDVMAKLDPKCWILSESRKTVA